MPYPFSPDTHRYVSPVLWEEVAGFAEHPLQRAVGRSNRGLGGRRRDHPRGQINARAADLTLRSHSKQDLAIPTRHVNHMMASIRFGRLDNFVELSTGHRVADLH